MVDVTTTPTIAALSARRRWWAQARTSLFWIVIVAFAVRFGYIVIGHAYRFHSGNPVLAANEKDFSFGFEMGRIGRSLAEGRGFSNPFNETTGLDRLGTAALSVSHRGCFPGLRSLQSHFGHTSLDQQQYLFRAYLHSDFSDREEMFQRKSRSLEFLDLGPAAVRYFLVHALDLGNQPRGTVAGRDFLADADNRRERRIEAMAAIWLALGRCSTDQHDSIVISSRLRTVGLVPPRQAR